MAVLLLAASALAAIWVPLNGLQTQVAAPQIELIRNDFNSIQIKVSLSGFSHETVSTKGGNFNRLFLEGEGYTTEIGRPQLPVIRKLIEIPYGAKPELVVGPTVAQQGTLAEFSISERIMPVQPYIEKIPGAMAAAQFVMDQAAYAKNDYTISQFARLSDEGCLRGHRFVMLEVFPLNYNPAMGKLLITSEIQIQINFVGSDVALTRARKARLADYQTRSLAQRLFLNSGAYRETDLLPPPLGLLVITTPHYAGLPIIEDFIAWKEQKGFYTTLATTQETGATAGQIKAYIQNAYDTWPIPPNYVLLIGDSDVIPYWPGQAMDNPGTDLYYATLEGHDCFPDVGLGRWSISNSAELTNIINKTLNYEQVLWSGNHWEKAAVFMASNDNWRITEATHEFVIGHYLEPDGYRSTRLYCHSYGATSQQVTASINAGRSLAIYAGHGYFILWLDGPFFTFRDVEALTNTYYPFVGSFACDTGQFMRASHECFGETWIRSPHGAIAFWGAAGTSYWIPDDQLERALFEGFCAEQSLREDENLTWISGMTNYAKLSFWRQNGGGINGLYYWELYNVLGDPSVDIWTDVPQNLTVSFPSTIRIGQTSLRVNVSGYPDWAMVNAYSDAEEMQFTDYVTNGVVNFNLGTGFTVPGTLHVWVTGHDCRPYHGTAAIVGAGAATDGEGARIAAPLQPEEFGIVVSPNPFNPSTVASFELQAPSHVSLKIYNTAGRLVTTLVDGWREAGSHEVTFNGSELASGMYIYRMQAREFEASGKMALVK